MTMERVKEGIKDCYGYKQPHPFKEEKFVNIGSSDCNKFEEMTALIEGCFIEAGEQGIDMREFIIQWEKIRMSRSMKDEKQTTRP